MNKEYKCNYCGKIVDKKTCVYSLDDNKKPFDIQCADCYSKEKVFIETDKGIQELTPPTPQQAGHGYCEECGLEVQPVMKCKCPERQPDGNWETPQQGGHCYECGRFIPDCILTACHCKNGCNSTPQQGWEKVVDKMDAEIMDWVYEIIKINFDTTLIQDSTELREILEENISTLLQKCREATLRSVLPEEMLFIHDERKEHGCSGHFSTQEKTDGFNACRQQIIKTAFQKWGIKL